MLRDLQITPGLETPAPSLRVHVHRLRARVAWRCHRASGIRRSPESISVLTGPAARPHAHLFPQTTQRIELRPGSRKELLRVYTAGYQTDHLCPRFCVSAFSFRHIKSCIESEFM